MSMRYHLWLILAACLPLLSLANEMQDEINQLKQRLSSIHINHQTQIRQLQAQQLQLDENLQELQAKLLEQRNLLVLISSHLSNTGKALKIAPAGSDQTQIPNPASDNPDDPSLNSDSLANRLYQNSFDQLINLDYTQAALAFGDFIERFPNHHKIPNALYWAAEANYLQQEYQQALALYQQLINNHPDDVHLGEAMLKSGYVLIELKRYDDASSILSQVIEQFPQQSIANSAREKLELISLLR